jgi:hypothetical protein
MAETHCSELASKRRGPKPSPTALKFRSIGLQPAAWEYLRGWQIEGEGDNFTPALNRVIEFAQRFAPGGAEVKKARNERGQFLPSGGTSKTARQRARRREHLTERGVPSEEKQ